MGSPAYGPTTMQAMTDWLHCLNDYQSRVTTPFYVHLDNCEVWADGELAGYIRIDGDTYVFEPTSKGAST